MTTIRVSAKEGLERINQFAYLSLENDKVRIKQIDGGVREVVLPYTQITGTDVYWTTITNEIEQGKSVIGRSVAGLVIAGSVGAVIGGMSGQGTKKSTESTKIPYFNISYHPSGGGEMKKLIFSGDTWTGLYAFATELQKRCNLGKPSTEITL